jgi:hypothetical protein
MNLCQLTTVKKRLGLTPSDVQDDAILTNTIKAVGGRFARECNRQFDYSATATFEFRADEHDIVVDRFPIKDVDTFHLKSNETDGWVEQTDIVYLLNSTKSIIELSIPLGTSRQVARVTFAGGYVLPGGTVGEGQTALPFEIEQAAVEQVVYWYQNRERLGLASISGEGGSVSQSATMNLLPNVVAVLRQYERYRP